MKLIFLVLLAAAAFASPPTPDIRIDQIGYLPNAAKLAMVVSKTPAASFTLNQSKDGKVVFRGTLGAPVDDYDSGDRVQTADFGKWIRSGTYYIDVPDVGRSWDFEISPDVYARAFRLAMRFYYGQRCGAAVDLAPDFPDDKHAACHAEGAYHASTGKTGAHASQGGWHDGAGYGRYVEPASVATGTLLWAFELYGARLKAVNLNIPESGNGQPDMLNETRWNLEWMLSLQDDDGGVWPEQTSERSPGAVIPELDKLVSLVIGTGKEPYKSSAATGDFAAVMALAGRVYQPYNPAFGGKCLRAAQKAWEWLEKNPNSGFRNPPAIAGPEYADEDAGDEHLWAAAELFRSTGTPAYSRYFLDHWTAYRKPAEENEPPSWSNVAPFAFWTYSMARGADGSAANSLRHDIVAMADVISNRSFNNRYRVTLGHSEYVRGSNSLLANYGMELMLAGALTPNARYNETALEDVHYLLGRNTFALSFVTRLGTNPVRHPYHWPSMAAGEVGPWPGMLVGGPNHDRQDPVTAGLPADTPPARCYVDDPQAFSVNGVEIQWNAPLVFLLAGAPDVADAAAAEARGKAGPVSKRR